MYPIIHKHIAYSYEDEVRLIHEVPTTKGWVYDWDQEEVGEGIFISTDLNILVDEVVISPFSPNWFIILVKDLMEKYGLNKSVSKSILNK